MCEAMDKAENRGKILGEAIGKNIGKILAYANVGLSVSEIAEKVGIPEEEVKTILLNEKG